MTKKQASKWIEANCAFTMDNQIMSLVKTASVKPALSEDEQLYHACRAMVYASLEVGLQKEAGWLDWLKTKDPQVEAIDQSIKAAIDSLKPQGKATPSNVINAVITNLSKTLPVPQTPEEQEKMSGRMLRMKAQIVNKVKEYFRSLSTQERAALEVPRFEDRDPMFADSPAQYRNEPYQNPRRKDTPPLPSVR